MRYPRIARIYCRLVSECINVPYYLPPAVVRRFGEIEKELEETGYNPEHYIRTTFKTFHHADLLFAPFKYICSQKTVRRYQRSVVTDDELVPGVMHEIEDFRGGWKIEAVLDGDDIPTEKEIEETCDSISMRFCNMTYKVLIERYPEAYAEAVSYIAREISHRNCVDFESTDYDHIAQQVLALREKRNE